MRVIRGRSGREYKLEGVLGQGAFGRVYYSPPFAIKEVGQVQKWVRQALKNETAILQQLDHPNIVRLVDLAEEGNSLFMVMEYCQLDLAQYLRKHRPDESTAIAIFRQVVSGLRCLVERGVVHRDLKPANILVNSRGEFKLADFGLARYVQGFDSSLLKTIAGTPLYMAPQILRKNNYTTKCDIWSAGVIFYELLTGRLPWFAASEKELYVNITTTPLHVPSSLSEWSRQVLQRMLVVSEQDRIGWEELFQLMNQPALRKRSKSSQRPSSAHSQRQLTDRSPAHKQREKVCYPADKLRQLLRVDLLECMDEAAVGRVMGQKRCGVSKEEEGRIREVLSCYVSELQEWYRREMPSLRALV